MDTDDEKDFGENMVQFIDPGAAMSVFETINATEGVINENIYRSEENDTDEEKDAGEKIVHSVVMDVVEDVVQTNVIDPGEENIPNEVAYLVAEFAQNTINDQRGEIELRHQNSCCPVALNEIEREEENIFFDGKVTHPVNTDISSVTQFVFIDTNRKKDTEIVLVPSNTVENTNGSVESENSFQDSGNRTPLRIREIENMMELGPSYIHEVLGMEPAKLLTLDEQQEILDIVPMDHSSHKKQKIEQSSEHLDEQEEILDVVPMDHSSHMKRKIEQSSEQLPRKIPKRSRVVPIVKMDEEVPRVEVDGCGSCHPEKRKNFPDYWLYRAAKCQALRRKNPNRNGSNVVPLYYVDETTQQQMKTFWDKYSNDADEVEVPKEISIAENNMQYVKWSHDVLEEEVNQREENCEENLKENVLFNEDNLLNERDYAKFDQRNSNALWEELFETLKQVDVQNSENEYPFFVLNQLLRKYKPISGLHLCFFFNAPRYEAPHYFKLKKEINGKVTEELCCEMNTTGEVNDLESAKSDVAESEEVKSIRCQWGSDKMFQEEIFPQLLQSLLQKPEYHRDLVYKLQLEEADLEKLNQEKTYGQYWIIIKQIRHCWGEKDLINFYIWSVQSFDLYRISNKMQEKEESVITNQVQELEESECLESVIETFENIDNLESQSSPVQATEQLTGTEPPKERLVQTIEQLTVTEPPKESLPPVESQELISIVKEITSDVETEVALAIFEDFLEKKLQEYLKARDERIQSDNAKRYR